MMIKIIVAMRNIIFAISPISIIIKYTNPSCECLFNYINILILTRTRIFLFMVA
jgi:hypothetical protein